MRRIINTANAPAAIGPYSQAVVAGDFLFLSGQIPLEPVSKQVVEGDVAAQTHQVLSNIAAVLAAEGLSFRDVVKATIFLRDMNDFDAVNKIYAQAFSENPPARSTVQVARLPRDVHVEIETVAFIPPQSTTR